MRQVCPARHPGEKTIQLRVGILVPGSTAATRLNREQCLPIGQHGDSYVAAELRMRAHATFGLINSTPHSVRSHGRRIAVKRARPLLQSMALAALMAPAVPDRLG